MTQWPTVDAPAVVTRFDPLLSVAEADAMIGVAEAFGAYTAYSEERSDQDFGGLPQRIDTAANFVATGGRFGRPRASVGELLARTNYFRESYAYGGDALVEGIEPLLTHAGLTDAARELHGREVVVPAIVYANLLVPGQELGLHTDVPEFRGANRTTMPQWLIVVMHHAGIFEPWRMPVATAVSYFGSAAEGAFAYYPEGPHAPARTVDTAHNTAVMLDTDSVFHGVDPVGGMQAPIADLRGETTLRSAGDGTWVAETAGEEVARYGSDEVRLSVSWKAYCFADDADRQRWEDHSEDLTLDGILDRLEADMADREPPPAYEGEPIDRSDEATFAHRLIATYIHFPPPAIA